MSMDGLAASTPIPTDNDTYIFCTGKANVSILDDAS